MLVAPHKNPEQLHTLQALFACWQQLAASEPVVIGFSGGGDSVALLHLLCRQAKTHQKNVYALIVDHGMKQGSEKEAKRAADIAVSLGASAQILPGAHKAPKSHQQARELRYDLLADAARKIGSSHIWMAHTKDDQFETFCLRILKKSGWRGLAAMSVIAPFPLWPQGAGLQVLRPLLDVRRSCLRDLLRQQKLGWLEDPANEDSRFARVVIRQQIQQWQNKGVKLQLIETAMQDLRCSRELMQHEAALSLRQTADIRPEGYIRFASTPAAGAMALAMLMVSGNQRLKHGVNYIKQIMDQVNADKGTRSLNGCLLEKTGNALLLMRDPGAVCGRVSRSPRKTNCTMAGENVWFDQRWLIIAPGAGHIMALGALPLDPRQEMISGLPAKAAAKLGQLPVSVRASLPVWQGQDNELLLLTLQKPSAIMFAGRMRGMETGTGFA